MKSWCVRYAFRHVDKYDLKPGNKGFLRTGCSMSRIENGPDDPIWSEYHCHSVKLEMTNIASTTGRVKLYCYNGMSSCCEGGHNTTVSTVWMVLINNILCQ